MKYIELIIEGGSFQNMCRDFTLTFFDKSNYSIIPSKILDF